MIGILHLTSEQGRDVMRLLRPAGDIKNIQVELWLPVLTAMFSDTFRLFKRLGHIHLHAAKPLALMPAPASAQVQHYGQAFLGHTKVVDDDAQQLRHLGNAGSQRGDSRGLIA